MFEKFKNSLKSFANKIAKKTITEENLENQLEKFEMDLVGLDIAYEAVDDICEYIKEEFAGEQMSRFSRKKTFAKNILKESIINILNKAEGDVDILEICEEKKKQHKPAIFVFLGINGQGKTTSIAKTAYYLKKNNYTSVFAACDTFRAGAIEQLEKHAKNLDIKVIKHEYKTDAASVAFDAIDHAEAKHVNAVLIDTAGRMETNKNLIRELEKIIRVSEPTLKIFVGSLLSGNTAYQQATVFNEKVGIDGSILTMADADIKGGAAVSVVYSTKKPIIFLGTGQSYDDLVPFDLDRFIDLLFSE
ncbi:MAG: signal recognition particle-docking protein FtsY [Candidatus Lokiarchaeota archaeon]|nr:signal recognition particle-docking protein FtsY [Candidatus Lokiarchaeota archaeon]